MSVTRALMALAALALPAVALAAAPSAQQTAAVAVDDLDLGTDKGQRILALRIHRAARSMCKAEVVDRLPQAIRSERQCVRQARSAAAVAVKALVTSGAAEADRGG